MSLRDINIQRKYINQGDNNVVDGLINPALKEAILYKRSVGFFSSSVFKVLLSSLSIFVSHNGKIQLVVSPNLSEKDIEAITIGYEKKEEIIKNSFLLDFENELKQFDDISLNVLSELVAKGFLDIKVASVKNQIGIYHDKLGIITDGEANSVVFYGSANSTINGYQNNYEKIRVSRNWIPGEEEIVEDETAEFDSLWNNTNEFVEVYSFSDSIKKSILNVVKDRQSNNSNSNPVKLRDYQNMAIAGWVNNNYKGFYVMATGTGKTWTAIYSAKELIKNHKSLIVIAAPYIHLVKQWEEDVKKVFRDASILMLYGNSDNWYNDARHLVIGNKHNSDRQIIFITTIKSFYCQRFIDMIKMSESEKLLIVDEAHRFTQRPEWIKDDFKYLLGLSATPLNGKNNEQGTELVNYFGGQVINLPIEDALKKHYLVPYYYKPLFVSPSEQEENKFQKISSQMASCYKNGVLINKDKFVKLVRDRLRVIAMAKSKLDDIDRLISEVKQKDHFVVYCGDGKIFKSNTEGVNYIKFVKEHIDKLGISTGQFTANEDMKRRMELVDMFNKNIISSLVAIRCLDEGINIPSIKSALILASNDDYREFVQRRGRILRTYDGKEYATIYDVVVLPSTSVPKMAIIELRRYYEYAKLAENNDELLSNLKTLLNKYGLTLEDITLYTEIDTEVDLDD